MTCSQWRIKLDFLLTLPACLKTFRPIRKPWVLPRHHRMVQFASSDICHRTVWRNIYSSPYSQDRCKASYDNAVWRAVCNASRPQRMKDGLCWFIQEVETMWSKTVSHCRDACSFYGHALYVIEMKKLNTRADLRPR